jgi:hypothetical protein
VLLERTEIAALSSHHLCYPRPEIPALSFHPVYLLRHPIERIDSVYAFERRQQSQTAGARAAKEKNFRDYVAWRMQDTVPRTIRDYQTCSVVGFHDRKPKTPVPADWLRKALNHLGRVDCLGVVDRYDESMVVFEEHLAPYFPGIDLAYVPQNMTRRRGKDKPLSGRVRGVIKRLGGLAPLVIENNSLDLALYRYANQRLDRARGEVEDFANKLASFRDRCERLKSAGQ